ncbi:MAG: hypothetical protein GY847_30980 [Proteobacteria bacterium]|nr:hypothetical protein [Pseudomonadota bacterium]
MIRLAPVALLMLAVLVPLCTGTIWGNLLLLVIACGIFLGTVSLGNAESPKELETLRDNEL